MVKIGFIYDGETEKVILGSPMFIEFLNKYNFELAGHIKYTGGKIERDTNMLLNRKSVEKVIILKDLEQLPTEKDLINQLKSKEKITNKNIIVIVKKMFEAWLLADTNTIKKILRQKKLKPFNNPENETNPHSTLQNKLGSKYKNLGKPAIAKLFIRHGFTINNAAKHKQCHSAKNFLKIIENLKTEFEI